MLNARGSRSSIVPLYTRPPHTQPAGIPGDSVVIGSQSYNWSIPILRMPGRAGMDLVLNLYYNSRVWDVDTTDGTITFNADRDFPSYGFRLDFGYIEIDSGGAVLTESDGTKRILTSPNDAGYYASTDGSNIAFGLTGAGVLAYANGMQVQYQQYPSNPNLWRPVWIKDTNGNYFGIAYVSGHDQLIYQISGSMGRVITFQYDSSNRLTSLWQYIHPTGTKTFVTFTWGNPYSSGYSWYNFSGLAVNAAPTAAQFSALTGCTYPSGAGYRFTYGDWGIIDKIESLSATGVTRSYQSYDYPLASAGALTDAPAFTHETLSPDGTGNNTSVWTYTVTKNGTGDVTNTLITDPNGNSISSSLDPISGLATSVITKDSSNATLSTISYAWTTGGLSGATLPGTITTTNDAGQQSSIQYGYDLNDETTDVYEYDFGLQLKRHTVTTYLNSNNTTHHILNLPTQILVKDGSGNTIARTDMAYDGTALTSVTGAANHDDVGYPASFTVRGNLASVTRYGNAGAGTGAFTRSFYYDSLGNLLTAQLDCCNQKTFNFTVNTQWSFPDSITRGPSGGPQFTTSYTYDPDSSLLLASTDENGQQTQYRYDSMGRPTQVLLPPQNGASVQLNTAYDDAAASPTVTQSSTANNAVTVTTLDGLGHVLQVDTENGSSLVSSVKYGYDKNWQLTQVSNPFAPNDTVVNTSSSYDGLGRVTQVTPPSAGYTRYQYSGNSVTITDPAGKELKKYTDALGRLIEVDEPGESYAGAIASGTVTVGGTLQSQSGQGAHGATSASAQVTITGSEHVKIIHTRPPSTYYDNGDFDIIVGGRRYDYSYGQNDSPDSTSSIAQALVTAINSDGGRVVNASLSGSTITLTAVTAGSAGNTISFSTGSTWDTSNWSTASFSSSPVSGNLSGGQDSYPGYTVYDSGTVSLTIGSYGATANYGNGTGLDGTAAAVASDLVGQIQAQSPPFSISVPSGGTSISITWSTPGVAGNVTVSSTSNSTGAPYFSLPSFTICPPVTANPQNCTTALAGGKDPYSSGLSHPFATTYTYDVLDNLVAVSEAAGLVNQQPTAGQPRSYVYDSLGRITSSTTPESGTVLTYYTDGSGNACAGDPSLPCRVQDARGIVKTLGYDGINRLGTVTYSDGTPSVTYQYDLGGAGAFALDRVTQITEGTNSQTFTYDNFGRITNVTHLIASNSYPVQYGYNLASQLASMTYPTGRVVTQNVDAIGRLTSISDGSGTYLSGLSYNAAGETLGLTLGNGVQGAFSYNDHLQISTLRYFKTGNSSDMLNLGYDYGSSNNGQIQTVHYYTSPGAEDTTKSENFSYDAWGRLNAGHTTTVNSTPGTWSLQWSYDRLGNRLSQTLVGGNVTIGQPQFSVDTTTNRIVGYCYDAAGNLLDQATCPSGSHQYTYDGANRLTRISAGPPSYTYFGALRIEKTVGTTTTVYVYSGSKPIVEYVNGSATAEYIYSGSRLLATVAGGAITYHHPDHLSNRTESDASGNPVRSFGHFPFGETWYETGTANKWKFTGYENDSAAGEMGLNYSNFRYQGPGLGRFMSADLLAGNSGVPQSLNRYSYVLGDPVNLSDPLGLEVPGQCPPGMVWVPDNSQWGGACLPMPGGGGGGGGTHQPLQDGMGGGGGAGGGISAVLSHVLHALITNPDCAALFGGLGNALSTIGRSTFQIYTPGMDLPAEVPAQNLANRLQYANAVTVFAVSGPPQGYVYLATRFFNYPLAGINENNQLFPQQTQANMMFHEIQHITTQKDDSQLGIDSFESEMNDLEKFQKNCQPKDIPVDNAPN
jgi:RHS repeat-associated protein